MIGSRQLRLAVRAASVAAVLLALGALPPLAPAVLAQTALAQTALAQAALAQPAAVAAPPADAPPPPGPRFYFTLQDQNATITTGNVPDRYYTNGLRLGVTTSATTTPDVAVRLGRRIWGGDGTTYLGFDLSQRIYTAADTDTDDPPLGDRPYAGVLLGTLSLWHDTARTRDVLSVGVGVLGPSALGQQLQDGFHELIGQARNQGWGTQLHDQPILQFRAGRTWRIGLGHVGDLETDALPQVSAALGNLAIYARGGASVRIGRGLDSDFGVAQVTAADGGGDAFTQVRPFAWYLFASAGGRAVAYDVTLAGNPWRDSRSVGTLPFVGEFEAGVAVIVHGARMSYTQSLQTQDFPNQKGGPHQMGALALTVGF